MKPGSGQRPALRIAEAVTRAEESRAEDNEHSGYAHLGEGTPLPQFSREQLYGAGWRL